MAIFGRIDPESIVSTGWRVTTTGWDHVIELGRDDVVYIDGRPLVAWSAAPERTDAALGRSTTVSEHAFVIDGHPALLRRTTVIRSDYPGVDIETSWTCSVDGQELGGPLEIVGPRDRPAVGTAGSRSRARWRTALALGALGLILGPLGPFVTSSTVDDPILTWVIAALLVAGVVAIAAGLLEAMRSGTAAWARSVRWQLLPFMAGLGAGWLIAARAGVGVDPGLTSRFTGVALGVFGLMIVIVVLLALRRMTGGRWRAPSRLVGLGLAVGMLGLLAFGLGMAVLGLTEALAQASHDLLLGFLLGGGLTALVAGAAVAWIGQRRAAHQP